MRKQSFLPILLGLSVCLIVIGLSPLNPLNTHWLQGNTDPTQHYLGWVFFRSSPWTFPLGLNPLYGLDISSSIVFSDSIPLLAILFKPISGLLPTPFQYFGIWLLLCFILQAWFAWKLMNLISTSLWVNLVATGIFLFAPVMLFRIGLHAALVGQFVILAGLYLNLRPRQKQGTLWWTLLLTCSVLIHFYLFVMVLVLWLCNLMKNFVGRERSLSLEIQCCAREISIIIFCVGVAMWQAGYFLLGPKSAAAEGYGLYKFTILSLFDSNGWSYLLPEIPNGFDAGEGFNYLGLGLLFLALFAGLALLKGKIKLVPLMRHWPFLLIGILGLIIFSLSNQIAIGIWTISYPLPQSLLDLASALRSSGRLFWPAYYLLIFLFIYLVIRSFKPKQSLIILSVALALQALDTSAGWLPIRNYLQVASSSPYRSPLISPAWKQLAQCYTKVLRVPIGNSLADWSVFANYAASYGLGTNSVFLSRVEGKIPAANQALLQALQAYRLDPQAIYILGDQEVLPFLSAIHSTDLLSRIDGYNVLIPNAAQCISFSIPTGSLLTSSSVSPGINEMIYFSRTSQYTHTYLQAGWAFPETWGTWSASGKTTLLLPLPQKPANTLRLQLRALVSAQHPQQRVGVLIDGRSEQQFTLTSPSSQTIEIVLPNHSTPQRLVKIELNLPDRIRPKNLGMGNDDRELAIGLESASFH